MSQIIKTKSALLAHVMKTSFVKEYVDSVSQNRPAQTPAISSHHPEEHK